MPKPEAKVEFLKGIPRDDLQAKFKEVAKLKSDLIKERNTLIAETNKKIGEITQRIVEYEGSMKVLMEFINRKKEGAKK